jgi:anti-sigma B factor antagonist
MIEVKTDEFGDIIIIHICGEFYIENIQNVEEVWNLQLMKNPKIIAINCGNLSYIDSSAIGTLVKFLNVSMNRKIKLIFYDLSPLARQIFQTARLNNFFTIISKEEFESVYLTGD